MGALLAQDGTLEERSNQFHSSELGAVDWDKIGNIAKSGANIFSNIFGGSSCSEADKQQRTEVAAEIRQYLTPQDRQQLVQGMENNIAPTPEAMARFFLGGSDCKHKNVTPGDQRFLNKLPVLIQQRKAEAQSQNTAEQAYTNATKSGIAKPLMYLLVSAGLGTAGYFGYQEYKKRT